MVQVKRAVISPWIRERCGLAERVSVYYWCHTCESGAFSVRYASEAMATLYDGYRDEVYFRQRNGWEPSYTRELNEAFGRSTSVIAARQQVIADLIYEAAGVDVDRIRVALDVGGDLGQFIPPEIPERYVLDPSERPLVSGVQRAASLDDVARRDIGLVIMTGVLEHVDDPESVLRGVREALHSSDALIVLAVPAGTPSPKTGIPERAGHYFGLVSSMWRPGWAIVDRMVAWLRRHHLPVGHFAPFRQSEHLTFFSADGLRALSHRSDLEVLLVREVELPTDLTASGRLQFSRDHYAVCRPRQAILA